MHKACAQVAFRACRNNNKKNNKKKDQLTKKIQPGSQPVIFRLAL